MMQRKVQLTGSSTLAVSLPKAWAKRYGIKPQMSLFLREGPDGSLTVSRQQESQKTQTALFDPMHFSTTTALRRAFIAKYLGGATTFSFKSDKTISAPVRTAILDQTRLLMGLEVVDETPTQINVQDFFAPKALSLEKSLRRTHDLVCAMQETLSEIIETGDSPSYQLLTKREDEVDRMRFLVLRLLNASLNSSLLLSDLNISTSDCLYYADVIRSLEKMADEAISAAEYARTGSKDKEFKKTRTALRQLNEQVLAMQRHALEAFFEKNVQKANETLLEYERLKNEHAMLGRKLAETHTPFELRAIPELVMVIARKGAHVAENALDSVLSTGSPAHATLAERTAKN